MPVKTKNEADISPEEQRNRKNFLEEIESLRREAVEIASQFDLTVEDHIWIDSISEDFSYKENLKIFLNKLSDLEQKMFGTKNGHDQVEVNQCLSRLRILREKAQTAFENSQTNLPPAN
jgi:hypothetical protein